MLFFYVQGCSAIYIICRKQESNLLIHKKELNVFYYILSIGIAIRMTSHLPFWGSAWHCNTPNITLMSHFLYFPSVCFRTNFQFLFIRLIYQCSSILKLPLTCHRNQSSTSTGSNVCFCSLWIVMDCDIALSLSLLLECL